MMMTGGRTLDDDGVLTITIDGSARQYTTSGEYSTIVVNYSNNTKSLVMYLNSMGSYLRMKFPDTWSSGNFVVGYKDFVKDATKFSIGDQKAKYESGTATVLKK